MKTLRGTPKHLVQNGKLEGFTYLSLTLPFQCNYHCLKCFNLLDEQPIQKKSPISLTDIIQVIEEAKCLGAKAIVIAGEGEPTLDLNIKDIVCKISELQMIPIVYSNGSTLSPEIIKFYFDHNTSIVLALDSLIPEIYGMLTGTNKLLSKVLINIDNARKVFVQGIEKKDGLRIVRLALNTTITSHNKNEVKAIKEFCGDDIYFICNPLAKNGNAVSNWNNLITDEIDRFSHSDTIKKLSESGGPLTLDKSGLCGYSINGINVGPNGDYMTCAYTQETNGLLGNIKNMSLAEAYTRKHLFETNHYKKYGNVPCLIRDDRFDDFVQSLKCNSQ